MRLSPFSLSETKTPSDTSGTPRARTSCARSRQHGRRWPAMRPPIVKVFMRHYTRVLGSTGALCCRDGGLRRVALLGAGDQQVGPHGAVDPAGLRQAVREAAEE